MLSKPENGRVTFMVGSQSIVVKNSTDFMLDLAHAVRIVIRETSVISSVRAVKAECENGPVIVVVDKDGVYVIRNEGNEVALEAISISHKDIARILYESASKYRTEWIYWLKSKDEYSASDRIDRECYVEAVITSLEYVLNNGR